MIMPENTTNQNTTTTSAEENSNQTQQTTEAPKTGGYSSNTESDDLKRDEMNYDTPKKDPERLKYPVSWGKQAVVSVSTTAIALLPIALKIYNKNKDPNMPSLTFSDAVDLIIYKIPDAYSLLERAAYGSKFEKFIVGSKLAWIFKGFMPMIPTFKNMYKQYKEKGNIELDLELLTHIGIFAVNTAIPIFFTNPYVGYAFEKLFKGSIENFIVTYLMRSSNPILREIGNLIPIGFMVSNRAKTIIDTVKQEVDGSYAVPGKSTDQTFQTEKVDYSKDVKKGGFFDMIDKISAKLGTDSGYRDPYSYRNYDPYGFNRGANSVWGGGSHM